MKIRTLIVDDSPLFRESISEFLDDLADVERVGVAPDGNAALEMIRACRPDLVLLDLQMPGLNGMETMERLRPLSPETRVVILTGHDQASVRSECLGRGADDFVSKNYMREELPAAVRRLFPGRKGGRTMESTPGDR